MATIEERAIAYRDDVRSGKYGTTVTDAYIQGATEQKAIDHSEEHLNWIIKLHEEWSSMFNPNNISFREWVDKAMEE